MRMLIVEVPPISWLSSLLLMFMNYPNYLETRLLNEVQVQRMINEEMIS